MQVRPGRSIHVPRLGPVIWKYGYREAIRDGIIARYSVARVKVTFTPDEARAYDEHSERVKRLLDALSGALGPARAVIEATTTKTLLPTEDIHLAVRRFGVPLYDCI